MALRTITLPEEQVKAIVKEAIQEMLLVLGINTKEHDDVVEFQQDMHFIRASRERRQAMENKAWLQAITMVVNVALASIIIAILGNRVH